MQERFVIKACTGKSIFNLSSPTRVILLKTGGVYSMWMLATDFMVPYDLGTVEFNTSL